MASGFNQFASGLVKGYDTATRARYVNSQRELLDDELAYRKEIADLYTEREGLEENAPVEALPVGNVTRVPQTDEYGRQRNVQARVEEGALPSTDGALGDTFPTQPTGRVIPESRENPIEYRPIKLVDHQKHRAKMLAAARGNPQRMKAIDDEYTGFLHKHFMSNMVGAREALQAGDFDAAAQMASRANDFFPNGSRIAVQNVGGRLVGMAIDEESGSLNNAVPITEETLSSYIDNFQQINNYKAWTENALKQKQIDATTRRTDAILSEGGANRASREQIAVGDRASREKVAGIRARGTSAATTKALAATSKAANTYLNTLLDNQDPSITQLLESGMSIIDFTAAIEAEIRDDPNATGPTAVTRAMQTLLRGPSTEALPGGTAAPPNAVETPTGITDVLSGAATEAGNAISSTVENAANERNPVQEGIRFLTSAAARAVPQGRGSSRTNALPPRTKAALDQEAATLGAATNTQAVQQWLSSQLKKYETYPPAVKRYINQQADRRRSQIGPGVPSRALPQ